MWPLVVLPYNIRIGVDLVYFGADAGFHARRRRSSTRTDGSLTVHIDDDADMTVLHAPADRRASRCSPGIAAPAGRPADGPAVVALAPPRRPTSTDDHPAGTASHTGSTICSIASGRFSNRSTSIQRGLKVFLVAVCCCCCCCFRTALSNGQLTSPPFDFPSL